MGNYYKRLGVSPSATSAEIKAAFVSKKKDAQRLMVSKNAEEAKKGIALVESLTEAYKILSSEEKRREYDQVNNISVNEEIVVEEVVEIEDVEEKPILQEVVDEKPIGDKGRADSIEKTIQQTKTPIKRSEPKTFTEENRCETRQINENREANNKNSLLIGGGAALIVIVIILLGYIGYQEFYAKEEVQTKSTVTSVENNSHESSRVSQADNSILSDTQFADYCYKKEIMDNEIAGLADEINNYIASHGDLKGATIIHRKCQDLRFDVENMLRDYRCFSKQTQLQYDLQQLMELELTRINALEYGVAIGLQGGKYTDGFRDGAVASQKFKKLNKAFNQAKGLY